MTNASLARKLARLSGGRQARAREAASRGPINLGLGMLAAAEDLDPRDLLAEEQDRRREALAERLLEIGLEQEYSVSSFTDTHKTETVTRGENSYSETVAALTMTEWYEKLAHAALAAAAVLYPEVPAEVETSDVPGEPLVPAEAFGGGA